MGFLELFIIAGALAMDAFAVAMCLGLGMKKPTIWRACVVGLYFGIFQGLMPVIGYFFGSLFADKITAFDHWVAFGLLAFLGARMIFGAFKGEKDDNKGKNPDTMHPRVMVPYAVATSIDALAVGVSFAFLDVRIFWAAALIAGVTFVLSAVGVKLGHLFGAKFKTRAEFIGGLVLILVGLKILLEHLLT